MMEIVFAQVPADFIRPGTKIILLVLLREIRWTAQSACRWNVLKMGEFDFASSEVFPMPMSKELKRFFIMKNKAQPICEIDMPDAEHQLKLAIDGAVLCSGEVSRQPVQASAACVRIATREANAG